MTAPVIRPSGTTGTGAPGFVPLALQHGKVQFLESIRIPVAVIGNMVFPSLALLFFVVPQRAIAENPVMATAAVAQLAVFSVFSTCLFSFGTGVAEDRAKPFDAYLRTLPAGPGPQLAGRLINGGLFGVMGLFPLLMVGALLTSARPSAGQLAGGFGLLLVAAVPFALMGIAIGYALSAKAALAVVQVVLFPMAFAGGLFIPPEMFPGWLGAFSQALPSRAARELVVGAATGQDGSPWAWPVLIAWGVLAAVLCVAFYRRDEGRRFR